MQLIGRHVEQLAAMTEQELAIGLLTTLHLEGIPEEELIVGHAVPARQRERSRVARPEQELEAINGSLRDDIALHIAHRYEPGVPSQDDEVRRQPQLEQGLQESLRKDVAQLGIVRGPVLRDGGQLVLEQEFLRGRRIALDAAE